MAEKRTQRTVLTGNPVSAGAAVAEAFVYKPQKMEIGRIYYDAGKKKEKLDAFHRTVELAKEELTQLAKQFEEENGEQSGIFLAHREMLEDEELISETELAIRDELLEPDSAIEKVFSEFAGLLGQVEDELIAARAADLHDVKKRLQRIYQGRTEKKLSALGKDVIVIAYDLLPSDTASLDRRHVKGIITETGGCNSHSAILARSFRIPAVSGVSGAVDKIFDGMYLALDAGKGEVILDPTEEDTKKCLAMCGEERKKRSEEAQYRQRLGIMGDGTKIELGINIGSCTFDALGESYDFVGLFRTEFLYMEKNTLPTEEEQFAAYRKVLLQAEGKPVTLRTLDIGGDKTLPYMELPKEENPFLGIRALRLCFSKPDIFITQLRAALRASVYGELRLMFPMTGGMEDIYRAKAYVKETMKKLDEERVPYDRNIKTGVMIETPAMSIIADMAAEEVDFASIGSNDLTQYVSAADRMNPEVSSYYQNCSPAMLRLLASVFGAFAKAGKPISVCGEMAGDSGLTALLIGLGARKLSMSASCLSGVKAALSGITIEEAEELAARCSTMRTQDEILQYLYTPKP